MNGSSPDPCSMEKTENQVRCADLGKCANREIDVNQEMGKNQEHHAVSPKATF